MVSKCGTFRCRHPAEYRAPSVARNVSVMQQNPIVVHVHSVFLWPTWAAATTARRAKASYVLSPRGMLIKALIRRRSRTANSAWIRLVERRNVENASAIQLTLAGRGGGAGKVRLSASPARGHPKWH
jgi:hypothetical protein